LEISCIVLAGGRGLRLGRDKTLETFGNTSLLERVVFNLSVLDSDIIIVVATKRALPQLVNYPKLRVVADIYPGKGALGGVYTGLVASESLYNLVVAGDMPFLNQALLRYMVQLADGFDLVLPRLSNNMVEPLHAVYSKNCLATIKNLLNQGKMRFTDLLTLVKVRYVEAEEIDWFDPRHLSFFNINTEADLKTARELIREGDITFAKR